MTRDLIGWRAFMLHRATHICFCLLLAVTCSVTAQQESREAEDLFKSAFQKDLEVEQRVQRIKEVAQDYPDNQWGDDALWVLAEVRREQDKLSSAVILWQQMLARRDDIKLETFTKEQHIYKNSRVSQLEFLLERSGHIYKREDSRTTRYDVMPLSIHDELGRAYEKLDMGESAIREYTHALRLAPGKYLTKYYQNHLKRLRHKYKDDKPEAKDDQSAD